MSSPKNYSEKSYKSIIDSWRHTHFLPYSPPLSPTNSPPTSSPIFPTFDITHIPLTPNSPNPTPSASLTQTSIPNLSENCLHELLHLSNLLDINIQHAIELTRHSPPSLPLTHPPFLDQINFHSDYCHCCLGSKTYEVTIDAFKIQGLNSDDVIIRKIDRSVNSSTSTITNFFTELVPWSNERPLKNKELNAIIGACSDSTLIGTVRVWFDELPPKSIDGYKGLKAAFLAYFMQQKECVKDPVKIHNIKQRDGETIEEFMEHFKIETGRMKGAPECMRISGFMHGVNNPELTKRLNEHIPKTVEEMMTSTTTFIRGETAAASKKKVHTPWKSHDHSK
ncbi:reverse transcriptase domain-containing protein [Tanacetum coccineum]|uniref:Reverse transcriptase domain-containing protein n=1 Tax=Tanacetum coccineum TaxID=301880 RepID=A0ABQ5DPW4_9ASTR